VLKNELAAARDLLISSRTIRRRLKEAGLKSTKPTKETYSPKRTKLKDCVLPEIINIELLMIG
jgi:transposase